MENQQLEKKKYLLFSMEQRHTGVDNVFAMLERALREARYLNRIPVIGKFTINPTHNPGGFGEKFYFEDYIDLSNSTTHILEDGYYKAVASHLNWIKEEAFELEAYFFGKIYFLSDDELVTKEMNRFYDVVIRRDPTFKYALTHIQYQQNDVFINFPYSQKVNQLTDDVLSAFGTTQDYAGIARSYFWNKSDYMDFSEESLDTMLRDIPLNGNYYACMHVRASINDRDYEQPIFTFASSKTQVTTVLNEAISKGSVLYIMSDIHQADFFDFLKIDYQVYRYYDFPNLKKLVTSEDKIDNIMLYLVEKNIMKHATVKILPPHKAPMVYHLNAVYDLSLLKEPPLPRPRPTKFQQFLNDCTQKLRLRGILHRKSVS